jgi:hypothetical protein
MSLNSDRLDRSEVKKGASKDLLKKLKEVYQKMKKDVTFNNLEAVEAFIQGLPLETTEEYTSLTNDQKGVVNQAFYTAELGYKDLICMSDLDAKSKLKGLLSVKRLRPSYFSAVVQTMCDLWPHMGEKDSARYELLFKEICKCSEIPSSDRLTLAMVLFEASALLSQYECFKSILMDPLASPSDRVESAKFLLANEDDEDRDLCQQILTSIIEDHTLQGTLSIPLRDPKEDADVNADASEDSDAESLSSEESESDSDDVPDFLRGDSDEDDDEKKEEEAAKEAKQLEKRKRKEEQRIVREKRREEQREQKGKEDRIKSVHARFLKFQERIEKSAAIRYKFISDFVDVHRVPGPRGVAPKFVKCIRLKYRSEPIIPDGFSLQEFVYPMLMSFFGDVQNGIRYRILCAGSLLDLSPRRRKTVTKSMTTNPLSKEDRKAVRGFLEAVAVSSSPESSPEGLGTLGDDIPAEGLPENYRADAADILLRTAKDRDEVERANRILMEIGFSSISRSDKSIINRVRTIYNNSQNIHAFDAGGEIIKFVESMDEEGLVMYSFEEICGTIGEMYETMGLDQKKINLAKRALLRISLDTSPIGAGDVAVKYIFCYVWSVACSKDDDEADELKRRMVEELVDMGETCTTGHVNRIVNVLSGHGFDMKMQYHDQIVANVSGRVSALMRDDPRSEEISAGMIDDADEASKKLYGKFITKALQIVKKELLAEFVKDRLVTEKEFNTAFEEASKSWSTGK